MYDSYVKDVFVFSLFFYENPNLLGIYLFISEETESNRTWEVDAREHALKWDLKGTCERKK